MSEHSLLGASGDYRWLACPGSYALSKTAPHRPSSIYAATGTLAHSYIENAVKAGKAELDPGTLGEMWQAEGHIGVVDQEFIDGVNVMLAYINVPAEWKRVEFRVDLDRYFQRSPPPEPLFGTVDAALLHDRETLEIVDYKNGAGVTVSPIENPQLLYYAAGVMLHLPPAQREQVQIIKLTIVQPHVPRAAPVWSWETTPLDLLMWIDDVLVPGVEACAQPDAPLHSGAWCRFCPVAQACPELHKAAVAMAQAEFDEVEPGSPGHQPSSDPLELASALDTAERAQLWIDRIREYALDRFKHQVRIPGWGLVPTRPTRKWIDPDATVQGVMERILDGLGLSPDEVWERKLKSPAQMEKLIDRIRGPGAFEQIAPALVTSVSTGVKIARTTPAQEDFSDVDF
jgi:hypothetical protein